MSEITLLQGNCLRLMDEIKSDSVNMVLADPPYKKTACFWDSIIKLDPMWEQLNRVVKKNASIVMTASQPFTTDLINSNRKMFRYCWVWNKRQAANFIHGNRMPMIIHEDVVVFYCKPPVYNSQKIRCKKLKSKPLNYAKELSNLVPMSSGALKSSDNYNRTEKLAISIIEFNKDRMNRLHSTQKPVALMEYMIRTYTNEGDTVLDFCMGSGTTGVAAKNLNRNFIGIELSEFYFGIAKRRIEETLNV